MNKFPPRMKKEETCVTACQAEYQAYHANCHAAVSMVGLLIDYLSCYRLWQKKRENVSVTGHDFWMKMFGS